MIDFEYPLGGEHKQMKSAEEVARAKAISEHIVRHFGLLIKDAPWIEERLIAYAEERVKEAVLRQYEGEDSPVAEIERKMYARGRAEALAEVVAIFYGAGDTLFTVNQIVDVIRAHAKRLNALPEKEKP
jgi:hypothetical protein